VSDIDVDANHSSIPDVLSATRSFFPLSKVFPHKDANMFTNFPNVLAFKEMKITTSPLMTPHSKLIPFVRQVAGIATDKLAVQQDRLYTQFEDSAVATAIDTWKWFEHSPYAKWRNWVPHSWLDSRELRAAWTFVEAPRLFMWTNRVSKIVHRCAILCGAVGASLLVKGYRSNTLLPCLTGATCLYQSWMWWTFRHKVRPYVNATLYWFFSQDVKRGATFPIWQVSPTIPTRLGCSQVARLVTANVCALSSLAVLQWNPHPLLSYGLIASAGCLSMYSAAVLSGTLDYVITTVAALPDTPKIAEDADKVEAITRLSQACVGIASLYVLARAWREFRIKEIQSALAPTTQQDIVKRDTAPNEWAGVSTTPLPNINNIITTVYEDLVTVSQRSTCHCTIDNVLKTDLYMLRTDVALIPNHVLVKITSSSKARIVSGSKQEICGVREVPISRERAVRIPDTDLALLYLPLGDWVDTTKFLPEKLLPVTPVTMLYRSEDGQVLRDRFRVDPDVIALETGRFAGYNYKTTTPTFFGQCMSPLISETKPPFLCGFHIGGHTGTNEGCAITLTGMMYADAVKDLCAKGVHLGPSSGTMPKQLYDVHFFESSEIHYKSAVRFLPPPAAIKAFGSVVGRVTPTSDVVDTIISPHVEEVMGVPNEWGPPSFKEGYPYQASLAFSANCSAGVSPVLLEKSKKDYLAPLLETVKKKLWQGDNCPQPLTRMQTVCGIDGKRYIDKMPPNTSVGYPLNKCKRDFLTMYAPDDYPDFQCPAELDQRFWDETEKMRDCFRRDVRYYAIFQACLKDEPTPKIKKKVRVFQSAPIALQLMLRMYFLPIARFMSLNSILSECAVGVNSQGPEWEELTQFMRKFGEDRILAGDYSKYDLRMPAQLVLAAFDVMISIATECKYSAEDIAFMHYLAHEVAYPILAINGDLIQLFGSNPSGHNLTVYINSIVNSLLLRCGYFALVTRAKPKPFRSAVAISTYGDDFKGSVRSGFDWFNHISFAKFLSEHDIVLTMPDKSSTPTKYMRDADADFLKRKNIYIPEIRHHVGALDDSSIFKSLHTVLRSPALTPQQSAAQNLDGAMREWFFHGRSVYDQRREQLQKVAELAQISHVCTELTKTFDDRAAAWLTKYEKFITN
jgi:hypothetical protein